MSTFAASSATLTTVDNYLSDGPNGKKHSVYIFDIVLATQGGGTNYIPAAQLNLAKIYGAGSAIKSDDSVIVPVSPSTDGSKLLFGGGASNAPADYTGTFRVRVWGRSL